MKNPKVGERVAVYDGGYSDGEPWSARQVGIIQRVVDDGLEVTFEGGRQSVHPKQCRRLVKKKRRSVWVCQDINTGRIVVADAPTGGFIEFREVLKK